MAEIPSEKGKKRRITEGEFEHQVYLDKNQIADFLISLGNQMKKDDKVTVETEKWEIPFRFRQPIELEIEFEGYRERELEIEIEMKGKRDDQAPNVS
ncbi:MAG: amphi-Trp domain-containing protein [Candidatus Thermoplasmatota archaeon]